MVSLQTVCRNLIVTYDLIRNINGQQAFGDESFFQGMNLLSEPAVEPIAPLRADRPWEAATPAEKGLDACRCPPMPQHSEADTCIRFVRLLILTGPPPFVLTSDERGELVDDWNKIESRDWLSVGLVRGRHVSERWQ